jgi:hypothetical protein
VQLQLELWPAAEKFSKQTAVWRQIDEKSRKRLVGVLARLIRQSVSTQAKSANEEGKHD